MENMMETELPRMESGCRQTPLSSKASAFSIEALMGQKFCQREREPQCTVDEDEQGYNQMDEDGKYSAATDASPLATSFDVHG